MSQSISRFHLQRIKSDEVLDGEVQLEMSGGKLNEGHPRKHLRSSTPVDATSNGVDLNNKNKTKSNQKFL
jgi:hypothetical protein